MTCYLLISFVFVGCGGAAGAPPRPGSAAEAPREHRARHGDGGHHGGHRGHGGQGFHHRFDDAASWAPVFDDPARDAWQKPARVVELMAIRTGMTAADVGAGTGYFEPWLSRAVGPEGRVIAVDVERSMVDWIDARAKREGLANVRAQVATGADPGLAPASVDRVLVVDTWHHVDDRPAYAKKLAASLKPGGAVWIVDFTKESKRGPPVHARLEPAEVVRELAAGGLSARIASDAGLPDQFVVVGYRDREGDR